MARSKRDSLPDDESDWAMSDASHKKQNRTTLIIVAAVTALCCIVAMFVMLQRQRAAMQRAEEERHFDHMIHLEQDEAMFREELRIQQEFEAERDREEAEKLALGFHAEGTPDWRAAAVHAGKPATNDPFVGVRDARALNELGLILIQTEQTDRAVEAFRRAAKLNPMYADNLEIAVKQQARQARIAPFPREVIQP